INCEGLYECIGKEVNPFWDIPGISKFWEGNRREDYNLWEAPKGLFWLCGDTAYARLPRDWPGSCTLGAISPSFFLLPWSYGQELGIPL
ncbi:ENR1 protein, partial [Gymnorhina tibicen]|nr:ENR1 protein [Gymnorhina tibicen]